jgi:hypothetical protein
LQANAALRDTVLRRDAQIADMSDGRCISHYRYYRVWAGRRAFVRCHRRVSRVVGMLCMDSV